MRTWTVDRAPRAFSRETLVGVASSDGVKDRFVARRRVVRTENMNATRVDAGVDAGGASDASSDAVVKRAETPVVRWSQRRHSVRLRFDARALVDVRVRVERGDREHACSTVFVSYEDGARVEGGDGVTTGVEGATEGRAYACALELYGSVANSRRAEIKRSARSFTVDLPKTSVGPHWPRLLASKEKFRHVVTDFDHWLDEDDELAADAAFKFDLNSLEKITNYEDKEFYFPDVDDSDDDMPDMTDVYDH